MPTADVLMAINGCPPRGCLTRGDRCLLTEPSLALRRRSTALRLKSPVVQRLVSVHPYGSRDGAPLRFRAGRGASAIDLQASAVDRPEGDRHRTRRRRECDLAIDDMVRG